MEQERDNGSVGFGFFVIFCGVVLALIFVGLPVAIGVRQEKEMRVTEAMEQAMRLQVIIKSTCGGYAPDLWVLAGTTTKVIVGDYLITMVPGPNQVKSGCPKKISGLLTDAYFLQAEPLKPNSEFPFFAVNQISEIHRGLGRIPLTFGQLSEGLEIVRSR